MTENAQKVEVVTMGMVSPITPAFVSEVQATQIVPRSRFWFQKRRWKGDGPPYRKIGGRVMYDREELIAWFHNHPKRTSTTKRQGAAS